MGVCSRLCSGCCGDFFVWLCRFLGLATVLVTWGIGVETTFHGHYLGVYIIFVAVLMTFLEAVFAIHYCVLLWVSEGSCCHKGWSFILWLDDWRRGAFYMVLSIACFIQPSDVWMGIIAGVMLVLSGVFYVFKTFKTNADKEHIKLSQNPSYDKYEDLQDDIEDDDDDDTVIQHHVTVTIMENENLGDQEDILEV